MLSVSTKILAFQRIYKLLNKYDFEIQSSNSNEYKCVICKRILCNACQADCGCRYCNKCVNEMLEKGNQLCPGDTELCKEILLSESNIQVDHRLNIVISKLKVKCPKEMCSYEGELTNMEEHLRLCSFNREKCPFNAFGCGHGRIDCNKMTEHLQSNIHCHCTILVDFIHNLKNEVSELVHVKENYEKNTSLMQNELSENREQIRLMVGEIENLKKNKVSLSEKIEQLKQMLEIKSNIVTEKVNEMMIENGQSIENILEQDLEDFYSDIVDNQSESAIHINETKSLNSNMNNKIIGSILWDIERLSGRKKKGNWAKSKYFYAYTNQYKLDLMFWANGYGFSVGNCITILLRVTSSRNDTCFVWPFRAKIVIKITNKYCPEASKAIVKNCELGQPKYNSFLIFKDQFDFPNSELFALGLLKNDCLTIECFVYNK